MESSLNSRPATGGQTDLKGSQFDRPDGNRPENPTHLKDISMDNNDLSEQPSQDEGNPNPVFDDDFARLQEMTAVSRTHEETAPPAASTADVEANAGAGATSEYGDDTAVPADGSAQDNEDEVVRRSVYVGNVDYSVTPRELQEHFSKCGKVVRVTIMVDKFSGHPKGFAYIEFNNQAAANNALMLANTTLKGRTLKVSPKRKNIAGLSRGRGRGRGRGVSPAFFGMNVYGMPFAPPGRGMRGSALGAYAPRHRGRGAPVAATSGAPY